MKLDVLGEGGFSTVYAFNSRVAMKVKDDYCKDSWWDYAAWIKNSEEARLPSVKPFLPVIYSYDTKLPDGERVAFMKRYEGTFNDLWEEVGFTGKEFDLIHDIKSAFQHGGRGPVLRSIPEKLRPFFKAVRVVAKWARTNGHSFDLHAENIFIDGGRLIIGDPVSFSKG